MWYMKIRRKITMHEYDHTSTNTLVRFLIKFRSQMCLSESSILELVTFWKILMLYASLFLFSEKKVLDLC